MTPNYGEKLLEEELEHPGRYTTPGWWLDWTRSPASWEALDALTFDATHYTTPLGDCLALLPSSCGEIPDNLKLEAPECKDLLDRVLGGEGTA